MLDLQSDIELSAEQLSSIAAAMKEMSAVDGEMHPDELAMIEQLMDGLDDVDGEHVDTNVFDTRQHKDIFLKAVALVALADGKIRSSEKELLEKYSIELGLEAGHGGAILTEVGIALLSYFRGVVATRPKMEEIGRHLGLSNENIAKALDPEV